MLIIGLTGGIGSGKTAAGDYLAAQGITVVDADQVAREIVAPGEPALRAIADRFGSTILHPDGSLDRAALRQRVFADPAERQALEAITHPAIRERIRQHLHASTSPYTLLVSPLLFETGQSAFCRHTVVIDADENQQQSRAAVRDGVSETEIARIMAVQMPRAERLARANDVVLNHGDREGLYRQLDRLHQRYLVMAAGVTND